MAPGMQVSRLKTKINFKRLASIELSDSEDPEKPADVKKRIQQLELLAKKLKVQLLICAIGIILIVVAYLIPWYFLECCALPLQESPCKRIRALPLISTNQSTLAEAVDEFTLALRAQTDKFRDTIEMPDLTDRQAASNATKNAVGQLLSQHASDLVGFGVRKREDARLKDVEQAIASGYVLLTAFFFICMMLMMFLRGAVMDCKNPGIENQSLNGIDKQEYSQNFRLEQLKTRVSLLYMATFICIAAIVTLFFIAVVGQYFYGSSTVFAPRSGRFTDFRNFSTKLEESMNREFEKLDMFMTAPIEVRRAVWLFEIAAIDTHIERHQDLKQYHVDRRTMPRAIGHVLPDPIIIFFSKLTVILSSKGSTKLRQKDMHCTKILDNHTLEQHQSYQLDTLEYKLSALRDVIEMPLLADRQKTLEAARTDFRELIQQHSANLAAFGALKEEDERREELKIAIGDGYGIINLFLILGSVYMTIIAATLGSSAIWRSDGLRKLPAEEDLQNDRLKKLKRQVPIFYVAVLICIIVQLSLYAIFLAGQYHSGSCPIYYFLEGRRETAERELKLGREIMPSSELRAVVKSFTNFPAFANRLQTTLAIHITKLYKFMQSPNLEVRQLGWKHENRPIDMALLHHSRLKEYEVDRDTMPRRINYAPETFFLAFLGILLVIATVNFGFWAVQNGSIWQPWKFRKYF
ncbi:hypothetical protein DdX_11283 [Ditylenchus destructor]|uniref:Uncharacterized protein n=1 Tax=Ditylenchus destructor TaxID=166010 RepID=A0AAD4N2X3_9BILA|nr:hypothetical protein DdX_11283 [Ditylenchus destructor]